MWRELHGVIAEGISYFNQFVYNHTAPEPATIGSGLLRDCENVKPKSFEVRLFMSETKPKL